MILNTSIKSLLNLLWSKGTTTPIFLSISVGFFLSTLSTLVTFVTQVRLFSKSLTSFLRSGEKIGHLGTNQRFLKVRAFAVSVSEYKSNDFIRPFNYLLNVPSHFQRSPYIRPRSFCF